jgi:hypothetical protein
VSSIFQKAARKCTKMHSIGMNSSMLLRWNRYLNLYISGEESVLSRSIRRNLRRGIVCSTPKKCDFRHF